MFRVRRGAVGVLRELATACIVHLSDGVPCAMLLRTEATTVTKSYLSRYICAVFM